MSSEKFNEMARQELRKLAEEERALAGTGVSYLGVYAWADERIAELEAELAALREAAAKAKWLLDDATYHDGRYGQQSAPDWQKRACKVSDDLAALLQEGE